MYNKIFISYVSEDRQYAEKLHSALIENGFEPWMDKKDLLPGQDWDFQIRTALNKANFIIILLSSTSVTKRSYIQREFRIALEYYQEKLDSDIYIIPVKIDKCEIPDKLAKFQWVEYDSVDSIDKIIKAIEHQRAVIIAEEEKKNKK